MISSIFNESAASVSVGSILLCFITSLILGFLIALVHKWTANNNRTNFLITLTLLPLLVSVIMIIVNGNLGTSVAIAGAFSLIRFRSMPGTSREILSIFFCMTIGLAIGVGHIFFAVLATVIGCIAIILVSRIPIFFQNKEEKILRILIPEDLNYTEVFTSILNNYTDKYELFQVKTTNMGSMFDLSYKVTLKKDCNEKAFIDDLRVKNGNLKIMLSQNLENGEF